MAGLEPATQRASVRERNDSFLHVSQLHSVIRRADARRLGGRLTAGHGEIKLIFFAYTCARATIAIFVQIERNPL